MSFLDKMKAAVGSGTAKIEVDVKNRPSKRGEDLVAVVRVIGGSQAQKMNYLVTDFRWIGKWQGQTADGRAIQYDGTAIFHRRNEQGSENVNVEAGKTMEFALTVKVPTDGPVASKDLKYDFGVRADIEGSPDPHFNTQFEIS